MTIMERTIAVAAGSAGRVGRATARYVLRHRLLTALVVTLAAAATSLRNG
jgi:hypothetical protein